MKPDRTGQNTESPSAERPAAPAEAAQAEQPATAPQSARAERFAAPAEAAQAEQPAEAPQSARAERLAAPAEVAQAQQSAQARARIDAHLEGASSALGDVPTRNGIADHAAAALATFDAVANLVSSEDADVEGLLEDTREELLDSYLALCAGRSRMAFAMLRGVMEGFFTSLYYRQQRISLNLWSAGSSFVLVHQMLDDHEFFLYYNALFKDEQFSRQYPNVSSKHIFEEARALYELLSNYVHKKSRLVRTRTAVEFTSAVERVFRIALSFVEREEDLPSQLTFPTPATFAAWLMDNRRPATKDRGAR